MGIRNINTSELRIKYRMAGATVHAVLKAAKVKPAEVTAYGQKVQQMWPNREANAALRAYRELHPIYKTQAAIQAGVIKVAKKPFAAKKMVPKVSHIKDFHNAKLSETVADLKREVAELKSIINGFTPKVNQLFDEFGIQLKTGT